MTHRASVSEPGLRARRRRLGALVVVLAILAAGSAVLAPGAGAAPPDVPPDDAPRGVVHGGLRADGVHGPCGGAFTLERQHQGRARCTHGPDPAPPGIDVRVPQAPGVASSSAPTPATAAATGAVQCYGDGTSGPRVQLVYARAADRADRYATYLATFRQIAARIDDVVVQSAAETGGVRHVRYVTDSSCTPTVLNVVLSASGDDTLDATIAELEARGLSRSDRKYLVWMDANVYCGIAEVYIDDRGTRDNYNNGVSGIPGMVTRVDSGCWGLTNLVEAHELMHNLGGVQPTAPHATPWNHCTDDYDRMCYTDGSGSTTSVVCPATSHEAVFDCNHDDYFSTSPPAGSYLSTRWNTADSAFLASAGPVRTWGYNVLGQLGIGTVVDSAVPRTVAAIPEGAIAVGAGAFHSLAVMSDGTVRAWGENGYGQLGNGTTVARTTPVVVPGLSGVTAVAAGLHHSLALRSDGTVWAWGWNGLGQLGDGTTVDRRTPVRVAGLTGVTSIAGGGMHSLARRFDGTVWSWGWNVGGQLGDGSTIDRLVPVQVPGLSGMTAVAAGVYHSLALRGGDGSVWAWGWNYFGQLGDNTNVDRRTPVAVAGLTGMTSVAAGFYHSLARSAAGTVAAWGWNAQGQLGDGTTIDRRTAVAVAGLPGAVTDLSGGACHSVALTGEGRVVAWGWNYFGQVGDGTSVQRTRPTVITGSPGARDVAAGSLHTIST